MLVARAKTDPVAASQLKELVEVLPLGSQICSSCAVFAINDVHSRNLCIVRVM